ncbi:MAG TPA: sigma-70 family RNA polymerase sigma factor [Urbifossiella sp.]|jgi:RNA polymerase sigma factor (sigma-70 family)|nr:sigma-70 family RNA polymerase sigma factor [Urbifossiella sp.]
MSRLAALIRRPGPDPRPDGDLLAAFLGDRDEPAFVEVVRRHGPLVWGACRRALPDPADAEDAFQATFLVLIQRARRLTTAPTVGPWLLRVAIWTARNARRKNARRLARFADLPDAVPDPRPAPAPAFDLDAALLGLPGRCRTAVLLCHLEGLTHREAAERLGCPEGTVSSLVSRGLARLRARLAGREPVALLAAAGLAAPAGVTAATVRSAAAFRLASLSAAATPAVADLTRGVLRMFWIKNATVAGFATVLLLGLGFGAGVSVRQSPDAAGQEKAAVKTPAPPAGPAAAAPYLVLTVSSPNRERVPYTIAEFDAKGMVLWSVTPGLDLAEPWNSGGKLIDNLRELVHENAVAGARGYLTRVRKDVTAPRDLRVVFATDAPLGATDAPLGGYSTEALKCCRDAGFEKIRFTGYVPLGGEIPALKPGPDGEAEGYRRYRGEVVETRKLLGDYEKALRRL